MKRFFSILLLSLMSLLAMATMQVVITKADLKQGNSLTKDGVIVNATIYEGGAIVGPGTFSTILGKFSKIEISMGAIDGEGWKPSGAKRIWTGNAASVSFRGMARDSNLKIIFTIEEEFEIKHKLKYLIDGVEYKTIELEEGDIITPESAPTKKFYTFSGWSEIPETMPAHDVDITGYFTYKKGDANGDGQITANDIVLISQYIMGNTTEINVEAADANGDGQVTANDIVYVSYYILHGKFPETQQQANAFAVTTASDPDVTVADFNIVAGETKVLTLDLNNTGEMTSIQCDIDLPDGIEFNKLGAFDKTRVEYDEVSDEYSHTKGAAIQEDGSIRFLIYSTAVKAFKGTSGAIVKFTVTASPTFDSTKPCTITIKNKEISATNAQAYYPEDTETKVNDPSAIGEVVGNTTATAAEGKFIKDNKVVILKNEKVYNTSGKLMK